MSDERTLLAEGIRVLLLEGHAGDADPIVAVLEAEGRPRFEIERTDDPTAAVRRLSQESFELVLIDVGAPDGTSLDVLERLRSAGPDTPLIAISLLDDEQMGLTALQRGADDFLHRGELERTRLVRRCRYAIERRQVLSELETADELATLRREVATLERCSAIRNLPADANPADGSRMRDRDPDGFAALVERYADLAERAIQRGARESEPVRADELLALTGDLVKESASPLDVLDIHSRALDAKLNQESTLRPVAYADATGLLAMGLMGMLTSHYRGQASERREAS